MFIITHLPQFQNNTPNGIIISYSQSPSWPARTFQSTGRLDVLQYHCITYSMSHVSFGFKTFNTEQDIVGGTVTRIRAGNREVVVRIQTDRPTANSILGHHDLNPGFLARLFNSIKLLQIPHKSFVIHESPVTPSTYIRPHIN